MNKYKKIILDNNIPLYLYVNPSMKNTFVSYNVLYGSSGLWFNFNNNGKDYNVISGYAHYLEHLLGEHCQFGNMYDNFQRRLQDANAYTAHNVTSYHFKGSTDIEKSIKELIISMEKPVFNKKDVEATRHAIIEEAASYCDNYGVLLVDMTENNLYSGFNKFDNTFSPIGNRETTSLITIDELYDCYNAFYTDNNKFIVIAGNVEEERIVDLLNNVYSNIAPHESHLLLPNIDFSEIKKTSDILYRDVDMSISSLGVKIKKPDDISMKKFNYCMSVIRNHLFNSKDYNDLNKSGMIDSFEYGYFTYVKDYINFIQSFATNNKKECCEILLELLSKKDITEKEYLLTQRGIIASEMRSIDDKYEYIKSFPQKMDYTDSFSDSDFFSSVDYNEFMDTISNFDFSNYTIGELKRIKK